MDIAALIDWTVVVVFLGLAGALAVLYQGAPRPSAIPPAIVFCLLRALEVSWTVLFMPEDSVVHLLRALSIVALAWLLLSVVAVVRAQRSDHLRAAAAARAATRARNAASSAQSEYDRARTDYQRLVRHRIANPLAALIGGLQTLLELDVPAEQRRQLLQSMLAQSRRLEHMMLDPTRLQAEERELRPVPRLDTGTDPDQPRSAGERVQAEEDAAMLNDQLVIEGATAGFMCECDDPQCATTLDIGLDEYLDAHANERDYVVAPTHVDTAIEQVVERTGQFWIVRKHADLVGDDSP